MAQSLPRLKLDAGIWKDLYAATGITPGTKLRIQNLNQGSVQVAESATEPTAAIGYNTIPPNVFLVSASAAPVGAWARAAYSSTIQVEEAA